MRTTDVQRSNVLLLIALALIHLHCRRPTQSGINSGPMGQAALTIETIIDGAEKSADEDPRNHSERLACLRAALATITGPTGHTLKQPLPILGEMKSVSPNLRSLVVQWVDPTFSATGIYLVDAAGKAEDFSGCITWDAEDKRRAERIAWTQAGFPVILPEENGADEEWRQKGTHWQHLHVPESFLRPGAELELSRVMGDGPKRYRFLFLRADNAISSQMVHPTCSGGHRRALHWRGADNGNMPASREGMRPTLVFLFPPNRTQLAQLNTSAQTVAQAVAQDSARNVNQNKHL